MSRTTCPYSRICVLHAATLLLLLLTETWIQPEALADPDKKPRFADRGKGVIADHRTRLMWTKADSWSALGKCLSWKEAQDYVKNLKTGGYKDWRLPTVEELSGFPKGIVERDKTSSIGAAYKDWREKYTLHLDPVFGPNAAYWLWTSETDGDLRAGFVDLRNGAAMSIDRSTCFALGARAVRGP